MGPVRAGRLIGATLVGISLLLTVLVAADVVGPGFLALAVASMLAGVAVLVLRS